MMKMRCRCHGVSGSCGVKTCWRSVPNFREIGDNLKKKYENSIEISSKAEQAALRRREKRKVKSKLFIILYRLIWTSWPCLVLSPPPPPDAAKIWWLLKKKFDLKTRLNGNDLKRIFNPTFAPPPFHAVSKERLLAAQLLSQMPAIYYVQYTHRLLISVTYCYNS